MATRVNPGLPPAPALAEVDDRVLDRWRECLQAAKYDSDTIVACEQLVTIPVEAVKRPLILRMLEHRGDAAALFARLWSYDDAVEAAALADAIDGDLVEALIRAGLLVREGTRIASPWRLLPFEGLWLLGDRNDGGADAVMGPGGTTTIFAHLLPTEMDGDVLDLGCGAGSLALMAARRGATRVWGTDLNPRATEVARFNARLNRVNAELATGDLFAPVEGKRFDRILSQPPFVICPPGTPPVTYLHGGPAGDAVSARLLREAGPHLKDGGIAIVLLDVPLGRGVPIHDQLRAQVGDPDLDVCAIVANGFKPDMQSAVYAMVEDPSLGERYARACRRTRDHLEATGVRDFRQTVLVMRRPFTIGQRTPMTATVPVHSFPRPRGRTVDEVLAALDLAASDETVLLASAVAASPWAKFEQVRRKPMLAEEPFYQVRFESPAVAVDQELSAASLLLLEKLGSARDVAAGIAGYAEAIEESPIDVRAAVIEFTRRALATGLLVVSAPAR